MAAVSSALALGAPAVAAPSRSKGAGRVVAVLGGGIAGLTAAHELAERGFQVSVYERKPLGLGGKARSMDVPDSAAGGRKPLPGEHGARFFPGFYRNIPQTLRRIPFAGNPNGCHDNLVNSSETLLARSGGREDLRLPLSIAPPPVLTPVELVRVLTGAFEAVVNTPPHEVVYFVNRLLVFFTSCEKRRLGTWERTAWWDYIKAEQMSQEYQQVLAVGLTRNLVAIKAETGSTRTVCRILEAMIFNLLGRGADGQIDRVLNAPTNEALIDPWVDLLRSLGVEFHSGWSVRDLVLRDGRIAEAVAEDPRGVRRSITADHFVQAMPVEHARRTWNASVRAMDPQLARCDRLETDWMGGIQYFLTEPAPIIRGHVNYIPSAWSVISRSEPQYWDGIDFPAEYGDGRSVEIVSAVVSEWDKPGVLYGKTARECTREEIAREVWAQIKAALNDTGHPVLKDRTLHRWHLDPAIQGTGTANPTNDEQLLVHPKGSWFNRPTARTKIPNLFLAGDYVQVPVDLATMEGANTSGKLAANALLDTTGSDAERAPVIPMYEAPELESFKRHDETRYRLGLPNTFDLG